MHPWSLPSNLEQNDMFMSEVLSPNYDSLEAIIMPLKPCFETVLTSKFPKWSLPIPDLDLGLVGPATVVTPRLEMVLHTRIKGSPCSFHLRLSLDMYKVRHHQAQNFFTSSERFLFNTFFWLSTNVSCSFSSLLRLLQPLQSVIKLQLLMGLQQRNPTTLSFIMRRMRFYLLSLLSTSTEWATTTVRPVSIRWRVKMILEGLQEATK